MSQKNIEKCLLCSKILDKTGWRKYRKIVYCDKECFSKNVKKKMLGKGNPLWKGKNVKLSALHNWVKRYFPKSIFCQSCKKVPPRDLANISQEYKRDLSDWEWLCRKCHMTKDGRMEKLKELSLKHAKSNAIKSWISRKSKKPKCLNCKEEYRNRKGQFFCSPRCFWEWKKHHKKLTK